MAALSGTSSEASIIAHKPVQFSPALTVSIRWRDTGMVDNVPSQRIRALPSQFEIPFQGTVGRSRSGDHDTAHHVVRVRFDAIELADKLRQMGLIVLEGRIDIAFPQTEKYHGLYGLFLYRIRLSAQETNYCEETTECK